MNRCRLKYVICSLTSVFGHLKLEPITNNFQLNSFQEYNMTTALILMGGMGLIISAVLALASKVFYVYVDPKVEAVEDALPGAN